jgi:hypothetical protein
MRSENKSSAGNGAAISQYTEDLLFQLIQNRKELMSVTGSRARFFADLGMK